MSCELCGAQEPLPFRCKYCGKMFCSKHRLPENHSCQGIPERSWQTYKAIAEEKSWQSRIETTVVKEVHFQAKKSLIKPKDWIAFMLILLLPSILYALAESTPQVVFCFLVVLLHAMLLHEMGHFLVAKHYGYMAKIELGGEVKSYGPLFSISILRTRYWGKEIEEDEEHSIRAGGPMFNLLYSLFCLIFCWRQGFLVAAVYNIYLSLCNIRELF